MAKGAIDKFNKFADWIWAKEWRLQVFFFGTLAYAWFFAR